MRNVRLTVVLALASLASASALGLPVQWTIQGMTFENGSTVSGTYVFDGDINAFSDIHVSVSAAVGIAAQSFDALIPTTGNALGAAFSTLPLHFNDVPTCSALNPLADYSCGTNLFLFALGPGQMTNGGGTVPISFAAIEWCSSAVCNEGGFTGIARPGAFASNLGSVTSIPEPSTLTLLLLGLPILLLGRSGLSVARTQRIT
jgi:hypothetical protein